MFRSVLVPLDGSPSAEFAVPVAQGIARRSNGTVHLVHVHVPLSVATAARSVAAPFYGEWEVEAKEQEDDYLTRFRERLGGPANVSVDHRIEEGSVVETIIRCAEEASSALIVMTTHGRGPLARAWLGSVADGVARGCSTPVLLLRPTADPEPMGEHLFRNILVTLDGSPLAEQVLVHATRLGTLVDASYTLARVVSPMLVTGYAPAPEGMLLDSARGPELELLIEDAELYLEEAASPLRDRGLRVETQVVVEMQPAVGILEFARERAVDLVAMATHGRRGISRLVLGSVADKVLRGTRGPILLYRPRQ